MPVDRSEFYNSSEKLVTVYQKFVYRTETYTYDPMGNRTVERILLRKEYGWSYEYYSNSNRLKAKKKDDGSEKWEYAYDPNGNLISKIVTKGNTVDTWEYAYDLLNQLEQVKKNGQVVSSYIYDPNGFRVKKVGSKGKIHYVPLLNGEVGYRKEFSGNAEYSFIYVGGQHLARVNGVIGGSGKKFYYQNDHLGSAFAITDENGNKVVERDFAPFGEKIKTSDREESYPNETEDGFTGKDFDEDIGLYYYNARFYDPEIGRFITEDSVADGNNLYAYCGNNPVNNIDPSGHISLNITGGLMNLACMYIPGLGNLMGAINVFGLFVKNSNGTQETNETEQTTTAVENNQPIQDPVQQNNNPATENATNTPPLENQQIEIVDSTAGLSAEAQAQTYLAAMGLNPDAVNGEWGNKSISATIVFQSFMGLEITGECDETTLAAMKEAYNVGLTINDVGSYFSASTVDRSKLTNGKITTGLISIKGNENNGDPSLLKEASVAWAYLYQSAAASDQNLNLTKFNPQGGKSGYRSFRQQQDMETQWRTTLTNAYNNKASSGYKTEIAGWIKKGLTKEQAIEKVLRSYAATPGTSNHGYGLAIDFTFRRGEQNTTEYQWLQANAARFGFTPYAKEIWHWNYTP